MKTCSLCGRTFPDEYSFCLTDGTHLGDGLPQAEEPTVVRERPPEKTRSRRGIILFALAALLSLSLGITAAVLYYFWPRQNQQPQIVTASPTATPSPSASPGSPPPRPTTPKPEVSPTSKPPDTPNDTPTRETSDPGTTRITFQPGRAQATITSSVSNQRAFVLSARSGQTLSAQVDSDDDCVNFPSGDPGVRFRTQAGDNSVTILNSCDSPSRFTLTVSIR